MSTFFEKLTGANSQQTPDAAIDLTSTKSLLQRQSQRMTNNLNLEPFKATHLKVDTQDTETTPKEIPTEEEGELTVDIYDEGDAIVIQSTVAGVKPEDLDVSITNDMVTIRGKRQQQEEVVKKNYYYKELFWGTFSRSIILPEEVEGDSAEANLKHGLLTIHLPKKKRGIVQKLKVKVI